MTLNIDRELWEIASQVIKDRRNTWVYAPVMVLVSGKILQ